MDTLEMISPEHLHDTDIAITVAPCSKRAWHHRLGAPRAGLHGAAVAITGRRQPVLDSAVEALTSEGIKAVGVQVSTPSMAYVHCRRALPLQPNFPAGHILTASAAHLPLELIAPPKELKDVCAAFVPHVKEVRGVCMAQGDVRKNQDCERWLKETCDRLGGLDILINCAAGNFLVSLLCIAFASGFALHVLGILACA